MTAIQAYDKAIELDPKMPDYFYIRGTAYSESKDYIRALADFARALRLDANFLLAHTGRGYAHFKTKAYDRAQADFAEVIRIDPQSELGYSSQAWMWASCADAKVRNGARAVEYATKACELTRWQDYWCLGSLAAASAEIGKFDDAVKWQRQALDCADGYAVFDLEDAKKRLDLYKANRPCRDEE